ncbi:MAG: VWA domain-containing protein [Myxococcales bacterium]|nr:VWA domain-containing protein [Myxococcales bacterium]
MADRTIAALLLVVVMQGCGSSGVESAPRCTPGATQRCLCSAGVAGVQSCAPVGSWTPCSCLSHHDDAGPGGDDGAARADDGSRADGSEPPDGAPACPVQCTLWGQRCEASNAYAICVPSAARPGCNAWATFPTSCSDKRTCAAGSCSGACRAGELMFVVDVSSSMLDAEKWKITRCTLLSFVGSKESTFKMGLRTFPHSSKDCQVPLPSEIKTYAKSVFDQRLDKPSASSRTPIAAALRGLVPKFGDPDEGQYVVLLTDGSETCDGGGTSAVLDEVRSLRAQSIKTIAIGIGSSANMTLLHTVAREGGTGKALEAADAASLRAALVQVATLVRDCAAPCFDRECGSSCPGACISGGLGVCNAFGNCSYYEPFECKGL